MTVRGCVVVGPDKWWWLEDGSADYIALHNVEHFSVTDNISTNGGDSGITIENSRYGAVAGNACIGNFGPGININNANFIHINGNVCINNCRRIKLKIGTEGQRIVTPRPGGILIFGQDILITNNQCCDSIVPSTKATQLYGLVIHPFSKNIIIGSNAICSNFLIGPPEGGGDIFDERPDSG